MSIFIDFLKSINISILIHNNCKNPVENFQPF